MAETPPSREELDLRRRARRRLVGAVALALVAVVVLPMVFDPEPRPLGDKVEIRIPDQATPFAPEPALPTVAAPSATVEPSPTGSPDPVDAAGAGETTEKPLPPAKPVATAKPEAKAAAAEKAAPDRSKAEPRPTAKPHESKPAVAAKAVAPSKLAAPAKPVAPAKPDAPKPSTSSQSAAAHFLQLGVFSSEANAGQMIAKAKVAGFKAASVKVGGQFKVRVGPVADRSKALDYQAKLKSRGLDAVLVEP